MNVKCCWKDDKFMLKFNQQLKSEKFSILVLSIISFIKYRVFIIEIKSVNG